ncbi:MAG: hypothetical protein NC925_00320 [Candidatus Omnitrophica bacterium]|nr:hypothetical protein [Candidatus Omnitrophota bacterium]MCM8831331.1 hypothetical protein [Candidatus Omnitrophota bacterium]
MITKKAKLKKDRCLKNKYFVDDFNRLIIKRKNNIIIPKGSWLIKDNKLVYNLDEKLRWRRKYDLSKKITFSGKWSLDKNHNLIFTLKENKRQFKNQKLLLKTELLDTKDDALVFLLCTKQTEDVEKISTFQLKGIWQQDKFNRLEFFVKRSKTAYDVLKFGGIWTVVNNTLIYNYTKTYLNKREKLQKTLTFIGYWQINQKNRLNYILNLEKNSLFSFVVKLESPNISCQDNKIKYSVGIGAGRNFKEETFIISGNWRIDKKLGIYFEVEQKKDNVNKIVFCADAKFYDNQVIFKLKNKKGEDLGISVTFTHNFIKKIANWFLEFAKENKEFKIIGGINIFW